MAGAPAADAGPQGKKRHAAETASAGGGGVDAAKRLALGDELPEEISEQDIQHMLDQADDVHVESWSKPVLRRMVLQFERKVKYNQEMRIKHADEPDKFLKSEVDLDEEVNKFNTLAAHPELYGDFAQLGAVPVFVGLLNHVNTDIAVDVLKLLSDLTDPDVMVEVEEAEAFVKALFDAQLCQMVVDVLLRINEESSDEDAQAVTNCLNMMENLADISPIETCAKFSQIPKLLPWLIKRVRAPGDVDYNRVYASEILGILLQNSPSSRDAMVRYEGVDKLLRGIAVYRKRDPVGNEESEYVQNMFGCLCALMLLPSQQVAFGQVQGLELMIRMMREHVFASSLALRLTDHAMRHCPSNCQMFVEKLGLKVLFVMFMKKGLRAKGPSATRESEEHIMSIIQSLCRYCSGTAVARVLNKFMENRFEKLERLLEMHVEYAEAVREADSARLTNQTQKIDRALDVDDEEQLFLDRCDAGLFTLQQVCLVLVRLANMGNRQATDEICKLVNVKGVPLTDVCDTLHEYCSHLDASAKDEHEDINRFIKFLVHRHGGDAAVKALAKRLGGAAEEEQGKGEKEVREEEQEEEMEEEKEEEGDREEERKNDSSGDEKSASADRDEGRRANEGRGGARGENHHRRGPKKGHDERRHDSTAHKKRRHDEGGGAKEERRHDASEKKKKHRSHRTEKYHDD